MAIKIGSNFTFQGQQPNFERDRFATKAAMKAFPETSIDDGHLSYCAEDGNTYQFKSSNTVDDVTGKWRVFKADVDLSAYAKKNDVAKKVDITGKSVYSDTNVKVATIPVDTKRFASITVTIDIRCRDKVYSVDIMVVTNTSDDVIVRAFKHSYIIYGSKNEKIYYYVDKSVENDNKVIIFYDNITYDTVYGRFTSVTQNINKLPILNMEVVTTIPEGAVEIRDIGYGNKNLFYATPKDVAGDPTFRAIDITDLPDLSSKYATKEKAFTKDTASTEPGQVVAGPATTQGNLYLRKLIADDIPDLKSIYQKLDSNGYQASPKILNATVRNNSGDAKSFIKASISEASSGKNSPDWYFATDGTIQDITASYYNKAYLDDKFKVISASLNDLASSSSGKTYDDTEVRQLISNNTSAIGTKADKSELSRYQPKYRADYVASSNLASLPITTGIIDLNGYTLTISSQPTEFPSSIINGAINVSARNLSLNSVILKNVQITSDIGSTLSASYDVEFIDCEIDEVSVAEGAEVTFRNTNIETCNASSGIPLIFDSTFATISCGEGGTLNCNIYDSTIVTLNATAIQDNCGFNNTEIGGKFYKRGIAKNNKIVEDGYESDIDKPTIQDNAPSCDAVKTKLANYVPKTSTSNIDIIAPGVTIGPDATSKAVKVSSNLVQFNIDGNMISLSQANGINFQTAVGKKVTIGSREVATMDVINAMPKTVFITQAAYNALTTKDANTIYYING